MKYFAFILLLLLTCAAPALAQSDTCANGDQIVLNTSTKRYQCVTPGALPATNQSVTMVVANAGSTGTTVNRLAKLTGAPSTAIITATTDTDPVAIGVCTANCGTTGNATIAIIGQVTCDFDGATTAGDYVINSTTTAGKCHDAGSTFPTAGAAYGRVLSTNGAGGAFVMELMTPDLSASAGNSANGKSKPGGSNTQIQYNSSGVFAGFSATVLQLPWANGANGTNLGIGTANQVNLFRVTIPVAITVNFIGVRNSTATNTKHWGVGLYSIDGATRVLDSGPLTMGASPAALTATPSAVAIAPGSYWLAWTCDDTAATLRSTVINSDLAGVFAAGSTAVYAHAANASSAGQLPSTTGTITTDAAMVDGAPWVVLKN